MHQFISQLYSRLPPFVRDFVASRYGGRSQRLRYGGSFNRHLDAFRERDGWTLERFRDWQATELRALLANAVRCVPYYRHLHQTGSFPIEKVRTPEDLTELPILEKEAVRFRPLDFIAEPVPQLHASHTSGTTGTPIRLYRSTETIRRWNGCFETRARNWAGVAMGDRVATLGGQLVVPVARDRPPFWVWNRPGKQLYMSVFHLAPQFIDGYLDQLLKRRIRYLYGYASALDALASHAIQTGRRDLQIKVAISNAEPLYAHQRERIKAAFQCEVRDTYAPTELTVGAFECPSGRMHLSLDMGITEIVDHDGQPCEPGEPGNVICTSLINPDQVLIRYRQGDRASVAPYTPCACGVQTPALGSIDGRCDDVVVTTDGRRIGRLDPVFKGNLAIREAQIVQRARDTLEVRVVPARDYSDADVVSIVERLRDRVGNMRVEVVEVEELERTSNGKLRAVVNLIDVRDRDAS